MITQKQKWFEDARFGCMIHFGLYSVLGGEWQGRRTEQIGEWIQSYFKIPCKEYEKLADAFNPTFFDAEKWVASAQDAGMKYMVVTAKHHDGFALYHSKVDKFNVVDATPFGRDIIKEISEACKKMDMRFGFYYSQELDWREPDGGGYTADRLNCNCMSWTNDWDYPDNGDPLYITPNGATSPQCVHTTTATNLTQARLYVSGSPASNRSYIDNSRIYTIDDIEFTKEVVDYELGNISAKPYEDTTGSKVVCATINNNGTALNEVMICAVYSSDRELKGVFTVPVNFAEGEYSKKVYNTISGIAPGDTVRAMVWNSIDGMVPFDKAEDIICPAAN